MTIGPIEAAWRQASPQPLWLIDPDKLPLKLYPTLADAYLRAGGQWALVGGSFLSTTTMHEWCQAASQQHPLPLILFPGSAAHLTPHVRAVLFLFLASGRNPQYLITHHIEAAPHLHRWGLEVLPTTYLLLDTGGSPTAAHYVTQTFALPAQKPDLIIAAALAGLYLGQRILYLDAGSGAATPPSLEAIQALRTLTSYPILVGGGIQTPTQLSTIIEAGATFAVLGTLPEKYLPSPTFWEELFHAAQTSSHRC
jgi:phosphoglycerol geranylgeranyltransferase